MTIESLIGLSTKELESLVSNEEELLKHFGWCLTLTRPERAVKTRTTSATRIKDMAKNNQLELGKAFAIQEAAKLGIKLEL